MTKRIERVLVTPSKGRQFVGYVLLEDFASVKELFDDTRRTTLVIYTLDTRSCTRKHSLESIDKIDYHSRRYTKTEIKDIFPFSERDPSVS